MYTVQSRDVTKFEFDIVQTSRNVFNRFEIRRMFQVFCCRMRIHGKNPCSMTDFMCTESQRPQTNLFFFSQIQPITQTTVIEYATQQ